MVSNETPRRSNDREGNNFVKFKIHIASIISSLSAYTQRSYAQLKKKQVNLNILQDYPK